MADKKPLVKVRGLKIEGRADETWMQIVNGVDLDLMPGEVLGLIGESGAGKSTIGLAAMGFCRDGCRISAGTVEFDGIDLVNADAATKRALLGKRIAYVAQSAAASFNPAHKIIDQHTEAPTQHRVMSLGESQQDAMELYNRLRLPNPDEIGFRYPHQVSGGQLQRAMTAMAMSCRPDLIIFDEPTTALDVTTQIEVLAAIRDIVDQFDTAAIYITHDLAVVAQMADNIKVLLKGDQVEEADTRTMLANPQEDYTKTLWAVRSFKRSEKPLAGWDSVPVVSVKNVTAAYGKLKVLHDISFDIHPGRTVAVVGESGSGKSTAARCITGLLPPLEGSIEFGGETLPSDYRKRSKDQLRQAQMIYQMADTALNPRKKIGEIIGRPVEFYLGLKGSEKRKRVEQLLEQIELEPSKFIDRIPSELSGGQKQRVGIARALAAEPKFIICDEVTSALDQLVAEGILRLLANLQDTLDLSYMFITHDLATVRSIADEVVVMKEGRVVEAGGKTEMFRPPHHPYTDLLLSSVPEMDPDWLDNLLDERGVERVYASTDKKPLVKVRGLKIEGRADETWMQIVNGVDLDLMPGEVLGLIGESGAGKSTIGLAAMGFCRDGCRISAGTVEFDGIDLVNADAATKRALLGKRIAYVAQSAAASFNPAHKIIDQHTEAPTQHRVMSLGESQQDAMELYNRLRLPNPDEIGFRYPHQVSGGQLQRAMTAMAMSCRPDLIIFDEPTTALDVTTQIEVLAAIRDIVDQFDTAAIYITHDLAVVAQMADNIKVLLKGDQVEEADTRTMLANPQEDYTKTLWAVRSFKRSEKPLAGWDSVPVVSVKNVTAAYGKLKVLHDISFDIHPGRTVAVVGESGSGKSTAARCITGLLPPLEGSIEFGGETLPSDYRKRSKDQLRQAQMIYQMADTALNPRKKIGEIIGRPVEFYLGLKGSEKRKRVEQLLEQIELEPSKFIDRIPSELSGGQKQRVGIARALAAEPKFIICDEVTSALDQLVAEGILRLLANLQDTLDLSYMFITHDLATVRSIADEVVVMKEGRVVEAGGKTEMFRPPHHPYTDLLLSSVPEMDPDWLDNLLSERGVENVGDAASERMH